VALAGVAQPLDESALEIEKLAAATSSRPLAFSPASQSMPATIAPSGQLLVGQTFTAYSGAPGATPTTPTPSSIAAIVPATCVPCPFVSVPPAAHE
jgi:hypothetical protein